MPRGIAELVREYLPVIEAFEPSYIEEMRGIARAPRSRSRMSCCSTPAPIIKLAKPEIRRAAEDAGRPDGCTGIVALPNATPAAG